MTRSPLFIEAQARLRAYIQEHDLRPGDRLPSEGELAKYLELSRAALREATRSLQTLGVIEARHGNGLFVAAFSFRPVLEQLPYGLADPGMQFTEIFQAREALEVGLMPAAASLASSDELAECEGLAERMDELEEAGESIADVDRDFHLTLYKGLNNSLVDHLIELFWDLYRGLYDTIPPPDAELRHAPMHLDIVRALRAGDGPRAMAAMRRHFDEVRSRLQHMDQPATATTDATSAQDSPS